MAFLFARVRHSYLTCICTNTLEIIHPAKQIQRPKNSFLSLQAFPLASVPLGGGFPCRLSLFKSLLLKHRWKRMWQGGGEKSRQLPKVHKQMGKLRDRAEKEKSCHCLLFNSREKYNWLLANQPTVTMAKRA